MKTGILASPTIAASDMQGSVMGMSAKGMDIASYFLRDKIYSDKILAVIREYLCNAVDEHRKYNITEPVKVTLEKDSNGDLYWSVRDFAKGLSDHGIRNIFGMYFESTKGGDNDSIGGFGIGSKAGLCYSDSFYITSYHDGLKTSYVCSLGAGQKGVPVGEIYDVSNDLTTETGIEIKIPVQYYDSSTFHIKTKKIVEDFTSDVNIEYTNYHNNNSTDGTPITYVPSTPTRTVDLPGGYKLSQYIPNENNAGTYVNIRMGGIVYSGRPLYNFGGSELGQLGRHVVDVPIGKLTLPISREAIETTPANDKVIDEIRIEINKLIDLDRAKLVKPTIGKLIDDSSTSSDGYSSYSYTGPHLDGELFTYKGRTAFPDSYRLKECIRRSTYTTIPRDAKGNHTVYLIPDIKNPSGWIERLKIGLEGMSGYSGHMMATNTKRLQELIASGDVDCSDTIFIDVKALKLPALPKKDKSDVVYLVYRNGYRQGAYTPDRLEKHIAVKYGSVDLDSPWWETVESIQELNHRTILATKTGGYGIPYFTANSAKIADAMYDLGWLSPENQEYKDAVARINAEEDARNRILSAEPQLRQLYFDTDFLPHIIAAVIKSSDKLEKLAKMKKAILAEDSPRGRILRKINSLGGYSGDRRINRDDLRKILSLK